LLLKLALEWNFIYIKNKMSCFEIQSHTANNSELHILDQNNTDYRNDFNSKRVISVYVICRFVLMIYFWNKHVCYDKKKQTHYINTSSKPKILIQTCTKHITCTCIKKSLKISKRGNQTVQLGKLICITGHITYIYHNITHNVITTNIKSCIWLIDGS
jgi:hypothetical protein